MAIVQWLVQRIVAPHMTVRFRLVTYGQVSLAAKTADCIQTNISSSFVMNPYIRNIVGSSPTLPTMLERKSLWKSVGGWMTGGIFDLCRNVGEKVKVSKIVTDKKGKIC